MRAAFTGARGCSLRRTAVSPSRRRPDLGSALILALLLGCAAQGPAPSPAADAANDPCAVLDRSVEQLVYATDGRWLAAAHADGRATVVELASQRVRTWPVAQTAQPRIGLTEDGSVLVVAAEGKVVLWSAVTGTVVRQLWSGGGESVSLKLSDSPTPNLLVTFAPGSLPADNVKVWRVADGLPIGLATGSAQATFTLADDGVLLLDELAASFEVLSLYGRSLRKVRFPEPLAHTAFAADGAYMGGVTGAGSDDEHLAVMAVGDQGFTWRSPERTRATRRLLFLENPSRVVVFGETAVVYDHTDGHVLSRLPALADARAVAAAPDGSAIAAATAAGVIIVSTVDGSVRPACR
jgi:hypothetical protein